MPYISDGEMSRENMVDFVKMLKKSTNLSDEEASLIAASKAHEAKPKSRMYYKIQTSRNMGGSKKVDLASNLPANLKKVLKDVNSGSLTQKAEEEEDQAIIEFSSTSISVMEDIGIFQIWIIRFIGSLGLSKLF